MIDIKSVIAKNISELRTKNGMTQLELADRLHYSDKAVSKWERGESVPEISTLKAISELFGVTLDYLTSEEHDEGEWESRHPAPACKNGARKSAVTAICVLGVWLISTLAYIIIDIFLPSASFHWLCFIYAVPASALVWLIFNSIYFNRRYNYPIVSLLMWGCLSSLHLSLFCMGLVAYQVYFVGAVGQVAIILWSLIRPKRK